MHIKLVSHIEVVYTSLQFALTALQYPPPLLRAYFLRSTPWLSIAVRITSDPLAQLSRLLRLLSPIYLSICIFYSSPLSGLTLWSAIPLTYPLFSCFWAFTYLPLTGIPFFSFSARHMMMLSWKLSSDTFIKSLIFLLSFLPHDILVFVPSSWYRTPKTPVIF